VARIPEDQRGCAELERCLVSDSIEGGDLLVITDSEVLAHLIERIGAGHLAWINGESGRYEFADEQSTILGAFGGSTVGASTATPRQRRAVAQFESGTGSVEMINDGVSGELAWLVLIERANVNFVGHETTYRGICVRPNCSSVGAANGFGCVVTPIRLLNATRSTRCSRSCRERRHQPNPAFVRVVTGTIDARPSARPTLLGSTVDRRPSTVDRRLCSVR